MLTRKQLKQLRDEITLNSLFLKDYENTLFIKPETACAFFDSYIDYLYELAFDNKDNEKGVSVVLEKYDNMDNLYNWYLCYESDPLPRDNKGGIQ